jgi:exopolysaccharide production protein ExoQ
MRQIPRTVVGRAPAPAPQLAPTPAWVQDPASSTGPTFLLCALLLVMILPADLNFAALVIQGQNTTSGTSEDHSIANRIVWIVVLLGSCWYIASRQRLWLAVIRTINPFYPLFIAVAVMSLAWSIQPAITEQFVFRLVVIMLCCTAFTLYGWRAHRFQDVMRTLLGAFLVGSIIFAVVLPQYGVQQFPDYASALGSTFKTYGPNGLVPNFKPVLRGLTFGKNQLGPLAGFGVIFWFHAWLDKETKFRWSLLCGGASLICLYWSHSTTSVLATAFAVVVMLMLRNWPKWLRRYMAPIVAIVSLVILVYSLVILKLVPQLDFMLTPITALTGKDLTFTDRTPIWQIIGEHIAQHPLLGTGYAAYWVDTPSSPAEIFKTRMFFYPGSSHNGYLDVANDLGVLGSVCLLGYIVVCLRQGLKVMTFDRNQGALYLVLLFYTFWSSMSESHWFSAGSVLFTVFTVSVCAVARTLLQHRFEVNSQRTAPRAASAGRMA